MRRHSATPSPPPDTRLTPIQAGIGWRHKHGAELLQQRPSLGFIEVHTERFLQADGARLRLLEDCRELYPLSLHGTGLSLGSREGVNATHLSQLSALVERTNPWLISDHAGALTTPLAPHRHQDLALGPVTGLQALSLTADTLDLLCGQVQQVQDRLKRSIAIENLSVGVTGTRQGLTEPEFLAQLVHRTGCQLLIDLNSLYVRALNEFRVDIRERLNRPKHQDQAFPLTAQDRCRDWIEGIPPAAVAELHVSGHNDCGNVVINDRSGAVSDPVWSLYSYAIRRWGPRPTLIEWERDIPPLQTLLDEAAHADTLTQDALKPCANDIDAPSASACRACIQACR